MRWKVLSNKGSPNSAPHSQTRAEYHQLEHSGAAPFAIHFPADDAANCLKAVLTAFDPTANIVLKTPLAFVLACFFGFLALLGGLIVVKRLLDALDRLQQWSWL